MSENWKPAPGYERDVAREYARVQVGEVLATVLREEGLPLGEFADRAGAPQARMQQLLECAVPATVDELAEILHAFGRRLVLEPIRNNRLAECERAAPEPPKEPTTKGYVEPGCPDAEKYQAWIDANVPADAMYQSVRYTERMKQAFPELARRGSTIDDGLMGHLWCVTPSGHVVDPTAHQFIERWRWDYSVSSSADQLPTIACLECGELCYDGAAPFCRTACERAHRERT